MRKWRFVESDAGVEHWVRARDDGLATIEFEALPPETGNLRIAVVTATWLRKRVSELDASPKTYVFPAVLVVPDGDRSEIERYIVETLDAGIVDTKADRLSNDGDSDD